MIALCLAFARYIPGLRRLAPYAFFIYLWHLLTHAVPLLWRFHRVHHSDLNLDVSTAKALTSDAAQECARVALQCHGAIAYTYEYHADYGAPEADARTSPPSGPATKDSWRPTDSRHGRRPPAKSQATCTPTGA